MKKKRRKWRSRRAKKEGGRYRCMERKEKLPKKGESVGDEGKGGGRRTKGGKGDT